MSSHPLPAQRPPLPPLCTMDKVSYAIAAALLLASLQFNLIPALFAGTVIYQLVHALAPLIPKRITRSQSKLLVIALISTLVIGLMIAAVIGASAFFRSGDNLAALLQKMAQVIEGASSSLPAWLVDHLPKNSGALRAAAATWLREHSGEMRLVGKEAIMIFVHVLIGMIVGAMIAMHETLTPHTLRPLSAALLERAQCFNGAFKRVVFAQVRISAINTFFTGIYLVVILPLLGISLPLTKTMILVCFVAGLLPVVGNLISNTVIVVISASVSINMAIASLVFLVVIHKLEYFLNAKIVGTQINSRAWELLLAMLITETVFGLAGLAAAPVFYAYLKSELSARELV